MITIAEGYVRDAETKAMNKKDVPGALQDYGKAINYFDLAGDQQRAKQYEERRLEIILADIMRVPAKPLRKIRSDIEIVRGEVVIAGKVVELQATLKGAYEESPAQAVANKLNVPVERVLEAIDELNKMDLRDMRRTNRVSRRDILDNMAIALTNAKDSISMAVETARDSAAVRFQSAKESIAVAFEGVKDFFRT